MNTINLEHVKYLADNSETIMKIIDRFGFFIEIGREESFINRHYSNIDEFTKKRLIRTLKEINPIIHGEYGLL